MYQALTCLAFEHDYTLVGLAALICVTGALTTVRCLQLALETERSRQNFWIVASAVAGGGSVWCTHFIAMLAYDPGVVLGYAVWPTLMSLLVAICTFSIGLAIFVRNMRAGSVIGGSIVGAGIVALHYLGMSGVVIPGQIVWNVTTIALSVVYSIIFSVLALTLVRHHTGNRGQILASLALVVGVVLLHFTGMGAITIVPDPTMALEPGIPGYVLAFAAAAMCLFVLAIAVMCIMFDRRLAFEEKQNRQRIEHMAYHDALTGLPNRAFLLQHIEEKVQRAKQGESEVAILAIDIDRFKQVNDIFGHQAGDDLLKNLTLKMSSILSPNEILARLGGDEFIIVQTDTKQPEAAERLAKRLLDVVSVDAVIQNVRLRTAISIGIALYPRDGEHADVLHSNADAALYRAKQSGRNCYRLFEPEMDLAQRARRTLQIEIEDAFRRDEFELHYQAQAETATGVITGFEALLRWKHPVRGLILPGEFIQSAEENGFIVELGQFVLERACTEAASWDKPLSIAVNLSPVQFQHGDLVATVRNVLAKSKLDPARLELEVTESVLINDMDHAIEILHAIKALGVGIAMDDFGTGYSSLAYLQAFPFDRIKIDRSFVEHLHDNKQSEAIVRAIVGLGQGLSVPITAEGVETEQQQAFLAELQCTEIQGYLIGKPTPIELLAGHVRKFPASEAADEDKRRSA